MKIFTGQILKAVVCGGILSLTLVSPFSLVLSGERTFAQGTDTLDRLNEPNQWGQDMFPEENKTNRFLVKYQIGEREKAEMEIEKHVKRL
ncbi:MAG: hypothetical protein PHT78_10490 [Desulfitobacteriaceae bacterium]|nr:hypothetical protein [Desulfitobacteriaceae bacterium]